MRVQISKNVDANTLASQLTASLGIPVALSTRNPGQKDADGNALPGIIVLLDPATGQELPDQDATKVVNTLAAHTLPVPPRTPARALADALGSAASLADIKTALQTFAGSVASQEDTARQRAQNRPGR